MKNTSRAAPLLLLVGMLVGLGARPARNWLNQRAGGADSAALILQIRNVAWLTTLDVSLYKKISFDPEPTPSKSSWTALLNWARYSVNPPHGKAIVFANVQMVYDFDKLSPSDLHLKGNQLEVVLPPLKAIVALRPDETEIIDSSLDSAQTAQLFALAKEGFEREALADPNLKTKAQVSARIAIQALLYHLGYREVLVHEK